MRKTDPRAVVDALNDAELIRQAIEATPDDREGHEGESMPATEFALKIAKCNPRTVRRYLAGKRPLLPLLRDRCADIVVARMEQEAGRRRGRRVRAQRA